MDEFETTDAPVFDRTAVPLERQQIHLPLELDPVDAPSGLDLESTSAEVPTLAVSPVEATPVSAETAAPAPPWWMRPQILRRAAIEIMAGVRTLVLRSRIR